ncbi:hypothetical protein GYMLUDRAFT_290403 [Collybiopsis luxurians FD-317 M1]|nr:hypothetical protein GYMLUDRAFT_290403 [Collybiopsis luxurians FD-317 M1]
MASERCNPNQFGVPTYYRDYHTPLLQESSQPCDWLGQQTNRPMPLTPPNCPDLVQDWGDAFSTGMPACPAGNEALHYPGHCPISLPQSEAVQVSANMHQTSPPPDIKKMKVGSAAVRKAAGQRRGQFSGIPRFACGVEGCGGRFTTKQNYQYHLDAHQEIKRYQCPNCSKAFRTSSDLKRHKRSEARKKI